MPSYNSRGCYYYYRKSNTAEISDTMKLNTSRSFCTHWNDKNWEEKWKLIKTEEIANNNNTKKSG